MPYPHPDIARTIQQQASNLIEFFGQDVTLRKYISASGGNPEVGIGDQWIYQLRPMRVDLRELSLVEQQAVGGQALQGGYRVHTQEVISLRDEIIYPVTNGLTYRVTTVPVPEQIGSNIYWTFVMTLSENISGTF